MSHRRRGADFSQLLESFNSTTDCGSDLKTNMQDQPSVQREADSSGTCSYKSTILAGQAVETESQGSTENSYRTAYSGSTTERLTSVNVSMESQRTEAPSLMNRAINLQFGPQSDLELSQSIAEPRTSDELNRNIETLVESNHTSRDTNYNIKNSFEATTSSTPVAAKSCPRGSTPRPKGIIRTPRDGNSESKILKRLSQEFIFSPREFTERLVTIIDETEMGFENHESSSVNLSRMTKEFRKLCKYIQDESMPEHMMSTLGVSKLQDDNILPTTQRPETIEESPNELSCNDHYQTPEAKNSTASKKTYRKTPLKLFKNIMQKEEGTAGSPSSPNSTRNFVNLEKYLNEQPPSPRNRAYENARSVVTSDISEQLRDKMRLVQKSEQQLASLDDTNMLGFETFDSHPFHGAQEREIYEPRDEPDMNNSRVDYGEINEDELSMSLRIELDKQRERCFETARQMQKIEEDAKLANADYPKVLERYGIDAEMECKKTIKSLLAYQNCWTKIRQNDYLKRNELSSLDSGIDTRSISRTLYSSSKKSYNNEPSIRSIGKNPRRYETSAKYPRLVPMKKKDRKPVMTGNLRQPPNEIVTNTRQRSPGGLYPTAKLSPRLRSRSREKFAPAHQVQSKVETVRAPQRSQTNDKRTNLFVPEVVIDRAEIFNSNGNSPISNSKTQSGRKTPQLTPRRVVSPRPMYLTSTPRASPIARPSSKERIPKMTNLGTASPASVKTTNSPRNRFFITPGRTVPIKDTRRRSKTLFPSMDADMQQKQSPRIMRSVHAPGIYRMGLNTVISPVSMYIHGTDMNLIQNVQSGNNEMLLTPNGGTTSEKKLNFKLSAKGSATPRNSPARNHFFTGDKNSESQSDDNDENESEADFPLPKTKYELPARVHVVDQSPKSVGGARTRGLLQSMQNRVVIRHQGRIFGKYDEHDVPESGSDSVDVSLHVQRSAGKTNYMNKWK